MESMESTIATQPSTPEAVEEVLGRCIERAQRNGAQLITGLLEDVDDDGRVVGGCAIGAFDAFARADERLGALERVTPFGPYSVRRAIEAGFDGDELGQHWPDWYAVGARLRERYQPVPASTIGGGA